MLSLIVSSLFVAFPLAAEPPAQPAPPPAHHAPAEGAAVIRPGDPVIDVSRIKAFDENWVICLPQEDGTVRRGITLHNALRQLENGTWEYRSEMAMGGNQIFYETVLDGKTLAPVRHRQSDPKGDIEVKYEADRIVGTIKLPGQDEPKPLEIPLDGPIFESGLASVIFGCLPLETGYRASIPSVDFHEGETGWISIEVTGRESIEPFEGWTTQAYRVEVAQLGDTASVRWIGTDPAGELRFEFGQGGGGYWQLLDPNATETDAAG